jgi:hypothetical protein
MRGLVAAEKEQTAKDVKWKRGIKRGKRKPDARSG